MGVYSDKLLWLDKERFVHVGTDGIVKIWRVDLEKDNLLSLENSINLSLGGAFDYFYLEGDQVKFSRAAISSGANMALYDLNIKLGVLAQISQDYSEYSRLALDPWMPVFTTWSPDGQFALITMVTEEFGELVVILDFLDGASFVEIGHLSDLNSCCWYWYTSD